MGGRVSPLQCAHDNKATKTERGESTGVDAFTEGKKTTVPHKDDERTTARLLNMICPIFERGEDAMTCV